MPSSKNYVRDYKQEYKTAKKRGEIGTQPDGKPSRNALRHRARRLMLKKGMNPKLDVDHKVPLSKGGGNKKSNLRGMPPGKNRSYKRTKTGAIAKA